MSSVPMANGGPCADIRLIGCNEKAVNATRVDQPHAAKPPTPPHDSSCTPPPLCAHSDELSSLWEELPAPAAESIQTSPERQEQLPADRLGQQKINGHQQCTGKKGFNSESVLESPAPAQRPATDASTSGPFHRIHQVREQQGLSVRSMARRLGIDVKSYKRMESPSNDLTLSQLAAIQKALDVPMADLLVDQHCLSRPVEERAKLVKAMKTAVALRETKAPARIERMAKMLCDQLIDLMPELAEVSGWPKFGARRGESALGKALQQPIDMSHIRGSEGQ